MSNEKILTAVVKSVGMVAGGAILIHRGFPSLGTPEADDSPLFFVIGVIFGAMGLNNLVQLARPAKPSWREKRKLKQALGIVGPTEPIEPLRKPLWGLYPLSLLLLGGGLAILSDLRSSAPQSAEQLVVAAMVASIGVGITLGGGILAAAAVRRHIDAIQDASLRAPTRTHRGCGAGTGRAGTYGRNATHGCCSSDGLSRSCCSVSRCESHWNLCQGLWSSTSHWSASSSSYLPCRFVCSLHLCSPLRGVLSTDARNSCWRWYRSWSEARSKVESRRQYGTGPL